MARIAGIARIRIKDINAEGVDYKSPLEDQCRVVYQAAVRYAEVNGFEKRVHPKLRIEGLQGQMVMSQLTRAIFGPVPTEEEYKILNGLINSVLRKVGGCLCIHTGKDVVPTWWINPNVNLEQLVVVALKLAQRGARGTSHFEEGKYLRPGEKKLRPEEVGEDQQPGEVTVTQKQKERTEAQIASAVANLNARGNPEYLERFRREQREIRERTRTALIEEISTNPVPLTASDLSVILTKQYGEDTKEIQTNESTIYGRLRELLSEGKLVRRLENKDERRVRGGGKMPPARGTMLYAVAPGPVPERTRLPTGIEPSKGMQDYHDEQKAERDRLDDLVLTTMKSNSKLRSKGVIARATGLPDAQVLDTLERLVRQKKVRADREHRTWFPTEKGPGGRPTHKSIRAARPEPTAPEPEQPAPTPAPAPEKEAAAPVANPEVEAVVSMVRALAAQAVDTGELEQVKRVNAALQEEATRLRRQVTALKAAIAAME